MKSPREFLMMLGLSPLEIKKLDKRSPPTVKSGKSLEAKAWETIPQLVLTQPGYVGLEAEPGTFVARKKIDTVTSITALGKTIEVAFRDVRFKALSYDGETTAVTYDFNSLLAGEIIRDLRRREEKIHAAWGPEYLLFSAGLLLRWFVGGGQRVPSTEIIYESRATLSAERIERSNREFFVPKLS